jgi:ABC-type bacteriocin/lantibiotic exporter with double-glycine peptidase domain
MVLDYHGLQHSQTELNRLFETTSAGTPRSRLLRLERYGLRVALEFGSELTISQTIDQNCPLIIFVRTGQLTSYWDIDTQHALVIIGYDDDSVFVQDPAFPTAPIQIDQDELYLAWLELDYAFAIVTK